MKGLSQSVLSDTYAWQFGAAQRIMECVLYTDGSALMESAWLVVRSSGGWSAAIEGVLDEGGSCLAGAVWGGVSCELWQIERATSPSATRRSRTAR